MITTAPTPSGDLAVAELAPQPSTITGPAGIVEEFTDVDSTIPNVREKPVIVPAPYDESIDAEVAASYPAKPGPASDVDLLAEHLEHVANYPFDATVFKSAQPGAITDAANAIAIEHLAARSTELSGAKLFGEVYEKQKEILRRQMKVASEATRLITGALTGHVGKTDPQSSITQDIAPTLDLYTQQMEMTTKVRSRNKRVRGLYTVWSEVDTSDSARCGVTIRRRKFRKPIRLSADNYNELLDKLARQFGLEAEEV